jgi:hypothetical protein
VKRAPAPPIVLQAAYQLRKSGHCLFAFCYAAKVFNHYGYSWACRDHHWLKDDALACAKREIARINANGG